jgi:hypothetical protein
MLWGIVWYSGILILFAAAQHAGGFIWDWVDKDLKNR